MPRRTRGIVAEPRGSGQQPDDLGLDAPRVLVPVAVDLPARAREPVALRRAPRADGLMGGGRESYAPRRVVVATVPPGSVDATTRPPGAAGASVRRPTSTWGTSSR